MPCSGRRQAYVAPISLCAERDGLANTAAPGVLGTLKIERVLGNFPGMDRPVHVRATQKLLSSRPVVAEWLSLC